MNYEKWDGKASVMKNGNLIISHIKRATFKNNADNAET